MCEKNYPYYQSPFFKNLPTSQNKRMEKSTYRQVISAVSSLYLKISPRGCSQNTRVSYDDIDKELDTMKCKIKSSLEFTEQQLSKLNNPIKLKSLKSPQNKRASFMSPSHIHSKNNRAQKCYRKEERLNTDGLDVLIDKCENFKPEIMPKKREIASHAFYRMNTSGIAYNYIEDLTECLKSTGDEEKIKNMMSTRKYNRNSDIGLKNELKHIKGELLQTTNKIVKMTPYRLWRQNNIAFMSNTDKVISSLPSVKN